MNIQFKKTEKKRATKKTRGVEKEGNCKYEQKLITHTSRRGVKRPNLWKNQ